MRKYFQRSTNGKKSSIAASFLQIWPASRFVAAILSGSIVVSNFALAAVCAPVLAADTAPAGAVSKSKSVQTAPQLKSTSRLNGSVNMNSARLYRPTPAMTPVAGTNYLMSQPGSVPPESAVSGADFSAFSASPAGAGAGADSNQNQARPDFSAFSGAPPSNSSAGNNSGIAPGSNSYGSSYSGAVSSSGSSSGSGSAKSGFDAQKALELGVVLASQLGHYVSQEHAAKAALKAAAGMAQGARPPQSALSAATTYTTKYARALTKQELTQLSKYDVVLIIDKSGSMDEHDCPGGMSRWEWCRTQLLAFTSQVDSTFRNGITVALFSSDFQIFNNVNFAYVQNIFANNSPNGGTYTGKVLSQVFDDYFARRQSNPAGTRKLLVQVITDGDPSDRGKLIETICKASQNINSTDEITVNFLQIGADHEGERTLAKLDNGLIAEGAQYDIVKVEPFSAVATEGLPRAVMDATH